MFAHLYAIEFFGGASSTASEDRRYTTLRASGDISIKSPLSVLDYSIEWSLAQGDAIETSTWSVYPVETGGLAIVADTDAIDDEITSVFIKDGLPGHLYELTNLITTDDGRTDARVITFRIGSVGALQ